MASVSCIINSDQRAQNQRGEEMTFTKNGIFALILFISSNGRADTIWNNGPPTTSGVALSIGWNQTQVPNFRYALTDDIVLNAPAILSKITIHGFMTGNTVNLPQINNTYVRLLSDNAGVPGSPLLGDFST